MQHRFHRSAAFASQSAAVPAERAVLEAELPKLRRVFVPKTGNYKKLFYKPLRHQKNTDATSPTRGDKKKEMHQFLVFRMKTSTT